MTFLLAFLQGPVPSEADLNLVLIRTMLIGGVVIAVSTFLLYLVFRSLGRAETKDDEAKSVVWLIAFIVFILTLCAILAKYSLPKRPF